MLISIYPEIWEQKKEVNKWPFNHNFFNHLISVEKVSRTICGIERIVNELSTLPNTKHNTDSFVVDVTMCMPKMIAFVVEGLFQEGWWKLVET